MKSEKNKKHLKPFINGIAVGLGAILLVWIIIGDLGLLPNFEGLDLRGDLLILCILLVIAIGFGVFAVIEDINTRKACKNFEEQELDEKVVEQLNENVWEKVK